MGVVTTLAPRRFIDGELVLKPAGRSRLALCRPSSGTLKLGLRLLGIPSLEWMGGGVRGISDDGFLAIRLESCLIHAHGFCMVSPLWG